MQRRSAALYGILGLIAYFSRLFAYFVAAGFRPYIFINLIAGVFLIIMWISSGWSEVGDLRRPALDPIRRQRDHLLDHLRRDSDRGKLYFQSASHAAST